MADNFRFAESDSLLCFHGPMLYEAKCLKRRKATDGSNKAQYFIHYKGWNSKWEEWVDDDRVLAVNSVNMNKMASLKEIHSNSKKSGGKRSITAIKEEPIRITTPPVKGRKRKHSEMSSESILLLNVLSPTDQKQKKRGRPPKTSIPKNDPFGTNEELDSYKVNEENTVLDEVEEIQTDLVIDTIKETETVKEIEKVEASETEEIEITKTVKVTQEVDNTEAIEGTSTTEGGSKPIEENTSDVFTVPAPVVTIIRVIDIPRILKQRIVYDHLMITKHNKMLSFENQITIDKLIQDYISSTSGLQFKYRERAYCIGLTLIQYFNSFIHTELIYDIERENKILEKAKNCLHKKLQDGVLAKYNLIKILYPKKLWHYVYGPTYLLRLFVNLPKHLSTNYYTDKQYDFIIQNFGYFLKYVENYFEKYFPEYETLYINNNKL